VSLVTPALSLSVQPLPTSWVLGASFAYLALLFGVAAWADRRAQQGRSVISNAWVYALSMAVYCSAWTYFGSVGRAAASGTGFLPIYLGPTLAMVLAWVVLRKMIRIARQYRITSIADFIASRYGKSRALAGLVTLIALVGVVLRRFDFPTAPVIVGLILGPLAEAQFRNAMSSGEGSAAVFFQRPMSATLLAVVVLVLVTPRLLAWHRRS
jgi:hypothetical protein